MSRVTAVLDWLEDRSDWLSPIVVKEVRQTVRGREFNLTFSATLLMSLGIAFFGAATAATGNRTIGSGTFIALTVCLTFLGLLVVPLGAFNTLRVERMEQTLELVTVTALSPRRVVLGKLMAQAVKLVTLLAGIAPFMAMSFLLGGIDFFSILMSLLVVFLLSLWMSAALLFLSTLSKARAMSGIVVGGAVLLLLYVSLMLVLSMGRMGLAFAGGPGFRGGPSRSDFWWTLAMMGTACVTTLVNLVLLAENRLSNPTVNRVTSLRIGFLVQFLLIAAWTLTFAAEPAAIRANAAAGFGVLGGLHLALVAAFAVTEDLDIPRRALVELRRLRRWRRVLAPLMPGAGRAAAYVLAQMALLIVVGSAMAQQWDTLRWLLALCGYICFFSGVPALAWRLVKPSGRTFPLRILIVALLPMVLLLPDLVYNFLWQPAAFDVAFGRRHLLDPARTLANWGLVEASGWWAAPAVIGITGLVAYVALIAMGARATARQNAELGDGGPGD